MLPTFFILYDPLEQENALPQVQCSETEMVILHQSAVGPSQLHSLDGAQCFQ